MKISLLIIISSLATFSFAEAQTAPAPSPFALAITGTCNQARVAQATVQEALVHLSSRKTDRATEDKIQSAENALRDSLYLTSELTKALCP